MPPLNSTQLEEYLAHNKVNIHTMSLDEFRSWLADRIEDASRQELFRQRLLIRDIVHQHRRSLKYRKTKLKQAEDAYRASPEASEIEELKGQLDSFGKAVVGLTSAVARNDASPEKLAEFEKKLEQTTTRYQSLLASCKPAIRLAAAQKSDRDFREAIGLTSAEEELERLGKERGHQSSSSGDRFEEVSRQETTNFIVPDVNPTNAPCIVLSGATLGCARGEFDQLVITPRVGTNLYDVLAIIEAKRNINDVVHGFRMRQENLAWFCGLEGAYDPALYRTDRFPDGRFTGTIIEQHGAQTFHFDQGSFHRFQRNHPSQPHLDHLYFVTEPRKLLGCTADELGRLLYQLATDASFDLSDARILKKFRKQALTIIDPFQTRDVLQLYLNAAKPENILFGDR